MNRARKWLFVCALGGTLFGANASFVPKPAEAARSGASFGGRNFRVPTTPGRGYTPVGNYRGTSNPTGGFFFFPGFLPFGLGGGASSLLFLGLLGVGAFYMMRSIQRARRHDDNLVPSADTPEALPSINNAHVHELKLALGRSGRAIRARLEHFAENGDTGTEAGLAQLASQTALELMREKDAIRYAHFSTSGALSYVAAETKMGGLALKERAKFTVERLRAADGKLRRATEAQVTSDEVLEYIVVTVILATRSPLPAPSAIESREDLDAVLASLGSIAAQDILGLEVIWTPADDSDALSESDVLTGYPDLRNV